VTEAELSKASTVFSRSDAVIVGSNLASGMDVWCVRLFCVCVVLFGGLIPRPRSPTDCLKINRLK
jgi:hypothetical protein